MDDICWRLFLCAKNQKPTTTLDLVTSYNLMMCCIDLIFANVLAEKRTDLINPNFKGLPLNWNSPDFDETQARNHCILKYFCDMTEEAKAMKATVFSKIMNSFFQANVSQASIAHIVFTLLTLSFVIHLQTIFGKKDTLLGLISNETFERNLRSLNVSYEQYVLSVGEFDERILAAYPLDVSDHNNLNEQALRPPVTPLTRKQELPAQPVMAEQRFEPVENATNNVKKLSANISRITEPSDLVKYGYSYSYFFAPIDINMYFPPFLSLSLAEKRALRRLPRWRESLNKRGKTFSLHIRCAVRPRIDSVWLSRCTST